MYTQVRSGLQTAPASEPGAPEGPAVSRNVVFLGLTSLFTDISSEMISTILPLYLIFYLRVNGIQLGAIDGLYQGISALARIWSGRLADKGSSYKEVAFAGYSLSAVSRLILLAGGPLLAPLAGAVVLDRIGKGIRTAPRDALISLSTPSRYLGRAFGVHRTLDTAGAVAGPIVAFSILLLLPGRFDAIFVASLSFAGIGLLVLGLLVRNRRVPPGVGRGVGRIPMTALLGMHRYRTLVVASAGLGLVTISDAFVYLTVQRRVSFNPVFLPLLYVATSAIYLLLAIPAGRLADRVGRGAILIAGYVSLLLVYITLLLPTSAFVALVASLIAFGCFYACTDGVMAALVSASLPVATRTAGLAIQGTVAALSALAASLVFGVAWTFFGSTVSVTVFMVGLAVATMATVVALSRAGPDPIIDAPVDEGVRLE